MYLVATKPNLRRGGRVHVLGKHCVNCHCKLTEMKLTEMAGDKCRECNCCVKCGRSTGVLVDQRCRFTDCTNSLKK